MKKLFLIIAVLLLIPGAVLVAKANNDTAKQQPSGAETGISIPFHLRPENLPTATRQFDEAASDYSVTGAQKIIGSIISILLLVAGGLAVFAIINNAWWLITAAGKEEQITQRKKGLMWAILGLVFVILSYITIQFIIEFVFRVAQQ